MKTWQATICREGWDDDSCFWAVDEIRKHNPQVYGYVEDDCILLIWQDNDSTDNIDAIFGLEAALYDSRYMPKLNIGNVKEI